MDKASKEATIARAAVFFPFLPRWHVMLTREMLQPLETEMRTLIGRDCAGLSAHPSIRSIGLAAHTAQEGGHGYCLGVSTDTPGTITGLPPYVVLDLSIGRPVMLLVVVEQMAVPRQSIADPQAA